MYSALIPLLSNACITLGRLGVVHSQSVASNLPSFLRPWCMVMRTARPDHEKATAFRGACLMLQSNPVAGAQHFFNVAEAMSLYQGAPADLQQLMAMLLKSFQDEFMRASKWSEVWATFPP
eukprot:Platyproteum_vivax@DN6270_c0_g1_i2.p1